MPQSLSAVLKLSLINLLLNLKCQEGIPPNLKVRIQKNKTKSLDRYGINYSRFKYVFITASTMFIFYINMFSVITKNILSGKNT